MSNSPFAAIGAVLTGGLSLAIPALISAFSGGGQQQQQQQQPSLPSYSDPSVQAAALAQQTAAANARGRASTIMTSGQGDTSPLTTAKKQLLGA